MRWIPKARETSWWVIAAGSSLFVTLVLLAVRYGLMGQTPTIAITLKFMLLATVVSFVFSLTGWLGLRWMWLLANAGLLLGIIFMAANSRNMSGWEDLAGFIGFVVMTVYGIIAGAVAEIVAAIVRRLRKK